MNNSNCSQANSKRLDQVNFLSSFNRLSSSFSQQSLIRLQNQLKEIHSSLTSCFQQILSLQQTRQQEIQQQASQFNQKQRILLEQIQILMGDTLEGCMQIKNENMESYEKLKERKNYYQKMHEMLVYMRKTQINMGNKNHNHNNQNNQNNNKDRKRNY